MNGHRVVSSGQAQARRSSTAVTISRWSFAAMPLALALALTGCVVSEVTTVRGGQEVTPDAITDDLAGIDPCAALSADTLATLGLAELAPVALSAPDFGCEWAGVNDFVTPSVVVWVAAPRDADPDEETVTVDGVTVNVYAVSDNDGRYIAHFDDVTLTVNYTGAQSSVDVRVALELAMSDVLAHYDRT